MHKILVIEDEPVVLENIIELVKNNDFDVIGASDGKQGIDVAKTELPELILCDVMMPEIDGYDVLKSLQQDPNTSTIPFIFLTARSEHDDVREGMSLGADDYLTKPFSATELFDAINSRLAKKSVLEKASNKNLEELRINLASSLPHELRTPLNGIIASTQLLKQYFEDMDNTEISQLHDSIYISAQRLNRLIVNFLYYAELELLHNDPKKISKYKDAIIYDPLFLIDGQIEKTKTVNDSDVEFDLDLENIRLRIFDDHFMKIVEECLDNAIKFNEDNKVIKVGLMDIDGHAHFKVMNYGIGMKKEEIKNIGAYVQFNRKIYEQQGSGLGLIIVKRILDIYNGEMVINSDGDSYTEVICKIPKAS